MEYLYKMWEQFFEPNDVIVLETGLINLAMHFTKLPRGAQIQSSCLWWAIGWATPASFGIGVATEQKRYIDPYI